MSKRALILPLLLLPAALLARELPDFAELVARQSAAVVNVSTVRNSGEGSPVRGDLEEFFRRFVPGERGQRRSLGSGFIIRSDGYVLTSLHVVEDADEILVTLNDRRVLDARVVGADSRSDLALLKVEADELPTVKVGRSDALRVGEWVLAIGSPFGFEHSVTKGIVSAKGRSLPSGEEENYVPFIQSDVAINPGNSGGPLFNLDGEVVGVNSQIYTRSGGFMGVSFSIPIDVAIDVADQLRERGRVSRGWLGVAIREVEYDQAEGLQLDKPAGAFVVSVQAGSPAEAAGLRPDDVILAFNGRPIDFSSQLPHQVGRTRAGTTAELLVMRDGTRERIEVEIGELESPEESAVAGEPRPRDGERPNYFGMVVEPVSDAIKEQLNTDGGVRVVGVGGAAAESGVREGDIVTRLDNRRIDSVETFAEVAAAIEGKRSVPLMLLRDKTPTFLALRVAED